MSYNETNNCKISSAFLMIFLAVALCDVVHPFTTTTLPYMPKRSTSLSMKRGRGSLKREINDSSSSSSSSGGGGAINWLNTNESVKELPSKDGEVTLIETGAFLVVNKQTNPKGAVSAMKYGGQIYCFEANCPQCKVNKNHKIIIYTVIFFRRTLSRCNQVYALLIWLYKRSFLVSIQSHLPYRKHLISSYFGSFVISFSCCCCVVNISSLLLQLFKNRFLWPRQKGYHPTTKQKIRYQELRAISVNQHTT